MIEPTSTSNGSSNAATLLTIKAFFFTIGRVWLFLFVLPCLITHIHLRLQLDRHWDAVTVRVASSTGHSSSFAESGLYARLHEDIVDSDAFLHYYKLLPSSSWWNFVPDVFDIADATLSGQRPSFPHLVVPTDNGIINETSSELCLFLSLDHKLCGHDAIAITSHRQVKNTPPTHHAVHPLPLLEQPATYLLLLLNVILAAVYWNRRVAVESVALLSYTRLMEQKDEVWRVFSGSTAHFDLWHLVLNMMSLTALGGELEGRSLYTSVAFFAYNLTLIPMVAAVHWGLQFLRQKYDSSHHVDGNRPSVGYSGVLFAWMVVAALGQRSTCPIIFLPDLCFPTYKFLGLIPFSWAPLVQLVVLQVILPRVSFTGHCAGIIVGFLLHWGFFPIRYFQPALAIPLFYLLYLHNIRNVALPYDSFPSANGSNSRWNVQLRYQLMLLLYSVTVLGPFSSAALSFLITIIFWYRLDLAMSQNMDSETAMIWAKGYIVAAVLIMVTDAMTLGSWDVVAVGRLMPSVVILLRISLLTYGILMAQGIVPKETDGIFEWILGYTTLRPCREWVQLYPITNVLAPSVLPSSAAAESSAFVGVGRRLGGGTTSVNPWKVRGDEKRSAARERDQ